MPPVGSQRLPPGGDRHVSSVASFRGIAGNAAHPHRPKTPLSTFLCRFETRASQALNPPSRSHLVAKQLLQCSALTLLLASCIDVVDDSVLGGDESAADFSFPELTPAPYPEWVRTARIGGFDVDTMMSAREVLTLMEARRRENVSVLNVDMSLSQYLYDGEFELEVAAVDQIAKWAHRFGMRAVIYYPSLEVLTDQKEYPGRSMAAEHPDWLQIGLDGQPNVFYGSQEAWVSSTEESAWMSPFSGYREYFLARIRRLAATAIDGIWIDVPLFMDTGAAWPDINPGAQAAFRSWSAARGDDGGKGYDVPLATDFKSPVFRAWIAWRHIALAGFIEAIRKAALEVNPETTIIIENFPLDYLDATDKGLDGAFRVSGDRLLHVWENDSVSNLQGMLYARPEDFVNKIAMYKWARAADRESPSWSFSYGHTAADASLVMAASVATGNAPFECQTPEITLSADGSFRTDWFGFLRDHAAPLLNTPREEQVGVWFSSASRDYLDYDHQEAYGIYGMYVTTSSPTADPSWWSTDSDDSAAVKPHLGGWRGAANALIQAQIPFRPIVSPGDPASQLDDLEVLWLPSAQAMSDEEIELVRSFTERGGLLIATGHFPGDLDEFGGERLDNPLRADFDLPRSDVLESRFTRIGSGLAFYRGSLDARDTFATEVGREDAAYASEQVLRILRTHTQQTFDSPEPWLLLEPLPVAEGVQTVAALDFTNLQQPFQPGPRKVTIRYRPPAGQRLASVTAVARGLGTNGAVSQTQVAEGLWELELTIETFSILQLALEPATVASPPEAPTYTGPSFATADRRQAAEAGLQFVLKKLRPSGMPAPYGYGVYTNVIDNDAPVARYALGHRVTSEHMGLLLRAAACMNDETAWQEAYQFVRDVMMSDAFHVPNWAVDPKRKIPVLQQDEPGAAWRNANAPLDDLRVVRGLLTGASHFDVKEAESLAHRILNGLYWTSVTDRGGAPTPVLPRYPGGVFGYAWNFEETRDPTVQPQAYPRGLGDLDTGLIPVDYQDVWTVAQGVPKMPEWRAVIVSAVDLMLDAELRPKDQPSGLYAGSFDPVAKVFSGDFENPENNAGKHLKSIQVLWTALHLTRAGAMSADLLDEDRRARALAAAKRTLAFFKTFYSNAGSPGRVPEYLTFGGTDVPDCVAPEKNKVCLKYDIMNLFEGEVRIYALLARLSLELGDVPFATRLIDERILPDRVTTPGTDLYGAIGPSTAEDGDAEAWNVLESILTLCLEAGGE